MTNNKYIIKSLAPWMMDELIAFSEIANFDIIFLRDQDKFYEEGIQKLRSNKVYIFTKPYSNKNLLKKLVIVITFFFTNIVKFSSNYNFVIGVKSIFWFLRLDLSHFSKGSNIHAQFATQAAIVSLLIKKYFNDSPKFSFTFHAYDIYFKNNWFNILVNNSHKAFSISQYNIIYVKKYCNTVDKIILSRLGVFIPEMAKLEPTNNIKFTLGLISWFVEKKGIKYLLQSFAAFNKKGYTNIKLILAGDGPLKEEILSFIDAHNLNDSIKYIGKIKGKEKEKFFKSIDAFILPAISLTNDQDGIPVVLMEAISYGIPIISTKVSGIPEICINNYNGLLIEEKRPDILYHAIKELIDCKEKTYKFSINSLNLAKTEYNIKTNSLRKLNYMSWLA